MLLDAGAGTEWSYKSKENGKVYRRSEGLAVASLEMFKTGLFSGDEEQPCRVDAVGLRRLTVESMAKGLQVTEQNQMSGLKGRTGLLMRLADALEKKKFFGQDQRPGNMLGKLSTETPLELSSDKLYRLFAVPPKYSCVVRPNYPTDNPLGHAHEWSCTNLARVPHRD